MTGSIDVANGPFRCASWSIRHRDDRRRHISGQPRSRSMRRYPPEDANTTRQTVGSRTTPVHGQSNKDGRDRIKKYCNSIDVFNGPDRTVIRCWRAVSPMPSRPIAMDHSGFRECRQEVDHPTTLASLTRMQVHLRRARQLGLAGHPGYSLEWHDGLRRAFAAGNHRSDVSAAISKALCRSGDTIAYPATFGVPISARRRAGPEASDNIRGGADPTPSSWPTETEPPHSSVRPSDSRAAGPTCLGIPRATSCNAFADGA